MFRVHREVYKCPNCGEPLPEVSNVEVDVKKRDVILSVGIGLGFGLFASAAWFITWWGALGVAFIAGTLTFLIQAATRKRHGVKSMEADSQELGLGDLSDEETAGDRE